MKIGAPKDLDLFDSNIEEIHSFARLKIEKVAIQHLQKLAPFFQLQILSLPELDTVGLMTTEHAFGTIRQQTVQLFAAALVVNLHFPKAKMALNGHLELVPAEPLLISPGCQLYLSQAGFDLVVHSQQRLMDSIEMQKLRDQFSNMSQMPQKKWGA